MGARHPTSYRNGNSDMLPIFCLLPPPLPPVSLYRIPHPLTSSSGRATICALNLRTTAACEPPALHSTFPTTTLEASTPDKATSALSPARAPRAGDPLRSRRTTVAGSSNGMITTLSPALNRPCTTLPDTVTPCRSRRGEA